MPQIPSVISARPTLTVDARAGRLVDTPGSPLGFGLPPPPPPPPSSVAIAVAIDISGLPGPNLPITFPSGADAGQLIGAITVTTDTGAIYVGTISIDNANFSLSPSINLLSASYPCSLYIGQTSIPAGSYSINVTADP